MSLECTGAMLERNQEHGERRMKLSDNVLIPIVHGIKDIMMCQ